jgi:hypothetical protein
METVESTSPAAEGERLPFYQVWAEVLTYPSVETFQRILADPTSSSVRAFLWIAVIGFISGVVQILVQSMGPNPMRDIAGLGYTISLLCVGIAAPIGAVLGLAISTAIFHAIAKALGGTGTFDRLVYCMAAISAPSTIISLLISVILTGLGVSRIAGTGRLPSNGLMIAITCVISLVAIAFSIYLIVLEVLALKAVETISTGKAILTLIIPGLVVLIIGACVAFGLSAALMQGIKATPG